MNIEKVIGASSYFRGISAASRKALAEVSGDVELKKRGVLFREGDQGQSMFLLVFGHIRLHKTTPDGREVVIKVVGPGEVFAEVVLFEEERYPVTAVALTDAHLVRLLKRDVHRLLEDEPFRNDFIAMLMRKQRYLAQRIHQLGAQDVEARFLQFLREQFGEQDTIHTAISKKEFAAAIGTTPETFSRLILKLTKKGRLSWRGKTLKLKG